MDGREDSESVEEVLVCIEGRTRAAAVSLRASSRVRVGDRDGFGEEDISVGEGEDELEENVEGSILFMNVHRFLLGAGWVSVVSFGSAASGF